MSTEMTSINFKSSIIHFTMSKPSFHIIDVTNNLSFFHQIVQADRWNTIQFIRGNLYGRCGFNIRSYANYFEYLAVHVIFSLFWMNYSIVIFYFFKFKKKWWTYFWLPIVITYFVIWCGRCLCDFFHSIKKEENLMGSSIGLVMKKYVQLYFSGPENTNENGNGIETENERKFQRNISTLGLFLKWYFVCASYSVFFTVFLPSKTLKIVNI